MSQKNLVSVMGLISLMSQWKRRVCFGLEAKSPRRVPASKPMKHKKTPAISAVLGALAAMKEKLGSEPNAHVYVTFTTNHRVPLSKLGAESRRLVRAIKAGGGTIRSIEFGALNAKAGK